MMSFEETGHVSIVERLGLEIAGLMLHSAENLQFFLVGWIEPLKLGNFSHAAVFLLFIP